MDSQKSGENNDIKQVRFELCKGWQYNNQVSYLKNLIGQNKPSVMDNLIFSEYEDNGPQAVVVSIVFYY